MSDQRCSDSDQSKRDIPSFIEPRPPLILNPFMRPRPQKGTNLLELFEEDSESDEPEWVQVYLRLKPCNVPNNLYEIKSDRCLITSVDTATMGHGRRTQHNVPKMYTFSHIFGPESSQKEIFENVVKDNLKKLPEGHNFTLLTYGASGSGKTYTLMGTITSPGLVPRSLEYVFRVVDAAQQPVFKPADNGADKLDYAEQEYELQWVKRLRQISAPLRDKYRRMSVQLRSDLTASTLDLANRTRYYVWVSFVEIYNEGIYDLLSNNDRNKATSKLRIREDASGNVYVKGARQAFVRSGEEAYDVLVAGKHNLQVAATGVHAHSSRSHCIFTITLLTETEGGVRTSYVRLCDLAGCERARHTRNTGARMQESRAINSSLHVLERCLHMLRRKQRQRVDSTLVPYRESKLTRLLGAGLSGARGEALSMVVTLNPAPQYAHETRHVLQLAAVAKDIQVNNTIVESTFESSTTDTTIAVSSEVMKLRADNERLHFELVQAQARNRELVAAMDEKQQEVAKTMTEIAEEAKDMTRQYYESQLQDLRAEMEEMQEEYENKIRALSHSADIRRISADVGTPTRSLQTKVAELMTVITILEEKLTAEKLARARAEEEIQHLRACIEERDEKGSEDAEDNEVVLTDSESEEEDEICNESLEPTFRKEDINRSRLLQKSLLSDSLNKSHNDTKTDTDSLNNDTIDHNDTVQDVEVNDSVVEKSGDTLKDEDDSHDDITQDSTYHTGESELSSKLGETNDHVNSDTHIEALNKTREKDDSVTKGNLIRGTYFVRDIDTCVTSKEQEICDKSKSFPRGTYFVKDVEKYNTNDISDSKEETIGESKDRSMHSETFNTDIVEIETKEVQKTLKETINKSTKSQELPVLQTNVISTINDDKFVLENKMDEFPKPPRKAVLDESTESYKRALSLSKFEELEKISYCEELNKENKMKSIQETSIKKPLNKSTKSYESDISLANFEQLEQATCQEPKVNVEKDFADIKIPNKKKTFFDDITKNGEDLIKINKEKKTYFDNIDVKIEPEKVNALPKHLKIIDDDRSPSIVRDDVTNDFEPNKIKKLLGESFTRPNTVSSVQKAIAPKKHESVDIFEGLDSPNIVNMKDKEFTELCKTETVQIYKKTASILDIAVEKASTSLKHQLEVKSLKNDHIAVEKYHLPLTEKAVSETVVSETFNTPKVKPELTTTTHKSEVKSQTIDHFAVEQYHLPVTQKAVAETILSGTFDTSKEKPELFTNQQLSRARIEKISPKKTINQDRVKDISSCIESARKSIENMVLAQKHQIDTEKTVYKDIILVPNNDETRSELHCNTQENNTIEEFENIYKDITAPRATEFDLLVSQELSSTKINESGNAEKQAEEKKYNLRHKINTSVDNKEKDKTTEEVLLESQAKCEAKPTKRNLRLRRRKNQPDDVKSEQEKDCKLKDIVNLQQEFSDVTLDVPAAKKNVQDIESPEKVSGEENLPPLNSIQSCPSKSVTRSRRKLFTPRAELLEESLGAPGHSDERICVPRPSYHRPRARRKL